ncbi:MAG: cell wall-active antibiotics response protein [Bacteroides sp.]|nr:cell wall-active antibiotics response protein [Bacteroides sp.]
MGTKQKVQFNGGHVSGKYLIAFLFIACGALLLGHNMGWVNQPVYNMLVSWQGLVAALGIYIMLCRHYISGLILLGISIYNLKDELGVLVGTDAQAFMLPIILVLIGIAVIFGHGRRHGRGKWCSGGRWQGKRPDDFETMNYTSADGFLRLNNAFGGVRQVMLDEMLKGGSIQTRFGGSVIDLRRTDIPVGETVLDVDCRFGGIEIYVPADWTVKFICNAVMSGCEDKRWEGKENPEKILVIRGSLSLSGIVIKG